MMRSVGYPIILAGLLMLASGAAAAVDASQYPQLKKLYRSVMDQGGYTRAQLDELFRQVKLQPRIIEIMQRPAEAMPWYQYRKLFLTDSNIAKGIEFWRHHADTLQRAEKKYGVPAEIIVATLGVETRYGDNTGGFKVIEALTTLGLDYPRRSKFFLSELQHFLVLVREQRLDPLSVSGSYAGAIGYPQFMPSSYRHYAVDFDGDGKSDLNNSIADAIGSIANYYANHKWKTGQPIGVPAQVAGKVSASLATKKLKTNQTVASLKQAGVHIDGEVGMDTPAALLELEGASGPEYRVVFDNFYVITRYNTSPLYAMAVQLLSEKLRDGYLGEQATR